MRKYVVPFILFVFVIGIQNVSALTYEEQDYGTSFEVVDNWEELELTKEREHVKSKFQNKTCGMLVYGISDFYEETKEEFEEEIEEDLTRESFNNSLFTKEYLEMMYPSENGYNISSIKKQNHNGIEMYEIFGDMSTNVTFDDNDIAVDSDFITYTFLRNGYWVSFQYFGDTSNQCVSEVETMVDSLNIDSIKEDFNMSFNWGYIFLALLITLITYMIVPFILRLVNGSYEKKEAKKIALWNSIIVGGIYFVLTIATNDNSSVSTWNAGPAVLYYGVNIFVLTCGGKKQKIKNKHTEKIIEVEESVNEIEKDYVEEETKQSQIIPEVKKEKVLKKKVVKSKYCKSCSGKLNENNQCKKCGKQYFHIKPIKSKSIIIVIGLSIALVVSIGFNIYQTISLKNTNRDNSSEISSLKREIRDLEDENRNLTMENIDYEEKVNFLDENIVFVLEGYGDYYYTYDCVQKITDGEYTYWAYNKEAAIYKGYRKGTCN